MPSQGITQVGLSIWFKFRRHARLSRRIRYCTNSSSGQTKKRNEKGRRYKHYAANEYWNRRTAGQIEANTSNGRPYSHCGVVPAEKDTEAQAAVGRTQRLGRSHGPVSNIAQPTRKAPRFSHKNPQAPVCLDDTTGIRSLAVPSGCIWILLQVAWPMWLDKIRQCYRGIHPLVDCFDFSLPFWQRDDVVDSIL